MKMVTLALRALLETGVVAGLALWGVHIGHGAPASVALGVAAPAVGFGVWGAIDFRHAGRRAEALRLTEELVISLAAAAALAAAGHDGFGGALAALTIGYHALVYATGQRLLDGGPSARDGEEPGMTDLEIRIWVGVSFGLAYVFVNAGRIGPPFGDALQVLAVVAVVGLAVLTRRTRNLALATEAPGRFDRAYWKVVAVEAAATVLGVAALSGPVGAPEAGVAWVSTVVGVHFVVLAQLWSSAFTRRLGGAIVACGIAGGVLAVTGGSPASIAWIAGEAPGVLLLASAYAPLVRTATPT